MPTDHLGERFARALAMQNADTLKELFTPRVDFRALTPSRQWESDDANVVVDDIILGTWFSPDRSITEVVGIDSAAIGPIERVGYRFQANLPDGAFVIEQQAYLRSENGKISWLRILCSGFVSG